MSNQGPVEPAPPFDRSPPGPLPTPGARKNRQLLVALGIGCGMTMLLAVAAIAAVVFWLKSRSEAAVEDLRRLEASASALVSAVPVPAGAPVALSGDCLLAYQCCVAIAAKATANSAAIQACEVFKTARYPEAACSVTLSGYRKTAGLAGVRCD